MDLQLAVIVKRCIEAHTLFLGARGGYPSILTPGFLNVAFLPDTPDPGIIALVPTLRAQRRGLPCLAPAQWAEVNGRRLRVANHGDDHPSLHANHHPEEAARSFHGPRLLLLLPDARLCSQPGPRCWPACRCKTGLTGPTLAIDRPKIHWTRTMAPPPGTRGGWLCPVSACPGLQPAHAITIEK